MEWVRISVERLFGFLTALIPGAAILLLFTLHYPWLIARLWRIDQLGYETKIAIALFCTFLAGWTLSTAFNSLGGAIGWALGRIIGIKEPSVKPWHDPNWRALLTGYLGRSAPKNFAPVSDETLKAEIEVAMILPVTERPKRIMEAYLKKAQADVNDFQWSGWWHHLHVTTFNRLDPVATMRVNLTGNFQAASVVLLCALPSTPSLRHWWLIAFCAFWLLV